MSKALGFGIIGCGMIADMHAQAVGQIEGTRLIGVTDVVEEARRTYAAKYGVRAFASVEELLACSEVDVVSICTPSGLHAPLAIQASNAGRHCVVEKPMAITLQQADDLIGACARNKTKVAVISQLRFAPAVRFAREAIHSGKLGKLLSGDIYMKYFRSQEYYDRGGWRGTWKLDGGGALMNQGIHGVDLLLHFMGPVKRVYGYARTLVRRIEVEDTASAVLEFESGALGVIQATTSVVPGFPRRFEIHGEKGTIGLEEDAVISWSVPGVELPADIPQGHATRASYADPKITVSVGHTSQIRDLVEAIASGRPPMVDEHEARKPVELILAIYESSRTHREIEIGR